MRMGRSRRTEEGRDTRERDRRWEGRAVQMCRIWQEDSHLCESGPWNLRWKGERLDDESGV